MNDRFKFRAWDDEKDEMYYYDFNNAIYKNCVVAYGDKYSSRSDEGYLVMDQSCNNLMQCY